MGQLLIDRAERTNPHLVVAVAACPNLKGWAWTRKRRSNVANVVNLRRVDHAMRIADWMAEQDWFGSPIMPDQPDRTYKLACSLAINDYSESRTDQFEMVDRMLSLARHGISSHTKKEAA